MLRKNYFTFLIVAALFLASSIAVFAQTSPVRGRVELKKGDGTTVPVEGALIDVYRTDAKGKPPSAKTNKKGEFAFAGLQLGQTFMYSVSAPGVQAQIFPNHKAGEDGIILTVYEGDGKPYSEEEARQLFANKKSTSTPPATTNTAVANTSSTTTATNSDANMTQPKADTPEQAAAAKKAKEEYDKKVAENEKVKNINVVVDKAISEGKAAFDAKNYDLAVAKYTEGYNADPEYVGTATVFLNYRAYATRLRGFETFKKAGNDQAAKNAALESVKKDFQDSVNDSRKALTMLKGASTTDPKLQKSYESYRQMALSGLVETHRLLIATRADMNQNKEAVAALDEYLTVEPDAASKTKTMLLMADTLRQAGDSENAIPVYRKILESNPDNVDVMAGLGLSLVNVASATTPANKEMMQEALNMLDRFTQSAPDTNPLKSNVKEVAEYIKTTGLTPQKGAGKPAPKKKP